MDASVVAEQAGAVIGLTAVIGKFIKSPETRDKILPLAALVIGIAVAILTAGVYDLQTVIYGVLLGGTSTGLYSVAAPALKAGSREVPVRAALPAGEGQ